MKEKILLYYYKILWKLSKYYIKKHNPIVIWVTWSIWKTSARMIIFSVLCKYLNNFKIYTSQKNFNWELWLSFSIFCIKDYSPSVLWLIKVLFNIIIKYFFWKKEYDIILLEYWIDHVWEMDFLLSIVKPDYSILTKIDKVHSLQFGSPDVTANEKFKLIYNTKQVIFLNNQDEYVQDFKKNYDKGIDVFYFSTNDDLLNNCDIIINKYELYKSNDWIRAKNTIQIKDKLYDIDTNLIWKENVWYLWVWLCLIDIIKYKQDINVNELKWLQEINCELQPWRFNSFKWIKESIIIDSSYNAAPNSMKKIIENVFNLKKQLFTDYKLILVLWDMRELWEFTEKEHRKLSLLISQVADYVFFVWESMKKYTKDELTKIWYWWLVHYYSKSNEAGNAINKFIKENNFKCLLLFKWSQNTIFIEEAIKPNLFNKSDENKLPRQSDWWINKKNYFFNN